MADSLPSKLHIFLRDRGVEDAIIDKIDDEKIDENTFLMVDPKDLKQLLPHQGDRLAAVQFCEDACRSRHDQGFRKNRLLQRLREKLKLKRTNEIESNSSDEQENRRHLIGNKHAEKETRSIEIGWINFDQEKGRFIQVKRQRGGGTRKIRIHKTCNERDIKRKALELFFPAGKSLLGNYDNFIFDVRDFKESLYTGTVSDLYDKSKFPVLRFYLGSTKIRQHTTETDHAIDSPIAPRRATIQTPRIETSTSETLPIITPQRKRFRGETSDPEVAFGSISSDENCEQDETIPVLPDLEIDHSISSQIEEDQAGEVTERETLFVHRGQAFHELMKAFMHDKSLLKKKIRVRRYLNDGTQEMAEDDGGVLRDCLSEFWKDFYECCTIGTNYKVPQLRHDFGEEKWQAVADIIIFGWRECGYFPVKMAPVFIEYCLWGGSKSDMQISLLKFVPAYMADILSKALKDFKSVDEDEITEVLDSLHCKQQVTCENFQSVLIEIAHKEIIQIPKFVIDCWSGPLKEIAISPETLLNLYSNLLPTNRNVIKMIKSEPRDKEECAVDGFLKSYIRELDSDMLERFIRFCTGSDLMTENVIQVQYTDMRGFCRRPIAHSCSSILDLPKSYENFMDFRTEFNGILKSDIWVMDMV